MSKGIFEDASMNLREWASNNRELEETFSDEDRAKENVMKVLGLEWSRETDTLAIQKVHLSSAQNDKTNKPKIIENDEKENNISEYLSFSAFGAINDCLPTSVPFGINPMKYSSVTKLLRVTAYVRGFIGKMKKEKYSSQSLTSKEIQEAEDMWIKHVQHTNFSEVYESLIGKKKCNLQLQLDVFIDKNGLLRCKGRLENASLTESARNPLLLPRDDSFTVLIVEREHKRLFHSGVSQTLSQLRYRYWIPSGRATVRKILRQCLVCRRVEGGAYKMPPMAPLPRSRVTESTPFSHIGLDYLGPLYIKDNQTTEKVWVCLYTCMVTRAVHLEMVKNMSTEAFLNSFRRFIACRGKPREVIGDNALHFKLAKHTIEFVWSSILKSEDVQSYCSSEGISWRFIVEIAPWMGGFYERLVGITKRSLRKSIGRKLLSSDQLITVIKEAEAIVNCRPLVYVGEDINSNITLTPSHFTCLNPNIGIPECEISSEDPDFKVIESSADKLLAIWKSGQKLLDTFWKIWKEEYLCSLRERTQTNLKQGKPKVTFNPRVGDVVLIKDNTTRGSWRLGKVIKLSVSSDGFVRSAEVKIASKKLLKRPLSLLNPIETSKLLIPDTESITPIEKEETSIHTERKAAKHAKQRLKNCFND
ncbi:uncharacterized protein LOC123524558 [Mercenaria mercenaria]|uniref:uncharacterized protein LOC123524558 n=1 Tax=Mercenaria mercenaria TaxID=6596 RepID=UPI001E1E0273|nr:uncharacterized protein LOC123524558 [Mercenaria mercenaria]